MKVTKTVFDKVHAYLDRGLTGKEAAVLTKLSSAKVSHIKNTKDFAQYKVAKVSKKAVVKAEPPVTTPVVVGYKAFKKDLICRNFKYKVGETFTESGGIKLCNKGFHFCQNPLDIFDYYDLVNDEGELTEFALDGVWVKG